jgi:hypothetical protein
MAATDVRDAVACLTVYEYDELETAIAGFVAEQRIGGLSVYYAVINDDEAVVKRVAGGVGAEVAVLGRVNHSCLVRLCGLCVHRGNTHHLVFEFAGNGALSDWLHSGRRVLGWKNRVLVAFDMADRLNYLHNYTNPPYVHKNLKSSNVPLDTRLRAKVFNFGLARAVATGGGAQMTHNVVGTEGYLALEYLEDGLIGLHLDVFAFGLVVLELLSGKEAAPARVVGIDSGGGEALLAYCCGRKRSGWSSTVAACGKRSRRSWTPGCMGTTRRTWRSRCWCWRCGAWRLAREPRARLSMGEVLLSLSAVYGSTLEREDTLD